MIRARVTVLALAGLALGGLAVGGCDRAPTATPSVARTRPATPPAASGKVSGDVAARKAAAHIEPCPPADARQADGPGALPDTVLPCLGGGTAVRLSSLLGQPTLINVWASWCGPCRTELPLLSRAHAEFADQVRFLGIDAGDPDPMVALGLLDDLGVRYSQVSDASMRTRGSLGYAGGLPLTVFVDEHGTMVGTERTPFRSYSEVAKAIRQHLGVSPRGVKP